MRIRFAILGLGTLLLAAAVGAQDAREKPALSVWATTQSMTLPRMLQLPPGLKLEDLPPEARTALGALTGPQRLLEVRLLSPGVAPANASATLNVPPGLKLGPTLTLEIQRPEKPGGEPGDPGELPQDFEVRQYWGCSETVPPGQPKVWKLSDISAAERARWRRLAARAGARSRESGWTEAVWPNALDQRPPQIAKDASLKGEHTLRSNYTGQVSFTLAPPVDFLEPVVFTSPAAGKKPDLKRTILLSWKPIPNALGYQAWVMAPKGRKAVVLWSAGQMEGGGMAEFPSVAEIRQMVDKGLCLPPTKTACNIPAGIFDGCEAVNIQVVAYGPGQAFEAQTPAVRVQTRSLGILALGGPDDEADEGDDES
ncbi:MAG: hypothetical protein HY320_16160 [Armatimonadetes bacterium]|nr:hypothetical protein [Armatimonadota bacterium]